MILVFGKFGQVATELLRCADVVALGREDVDLSDPKACTNAIRHHAPKIVINAAAFTAVDLAEDEEAIATAINGVAPTVMAEECAALGIPLVHISTDYVFEGNGEKPWLPNDPTSPQNAYGRSKLLAENGIRMSGADHVILRTSWLVSAHGTNFVKTMLRLSKTREALNVVADQIGGPTPARDIAKACLQIANQIIQDPSKSGTYHLSGTPDVSWAELASIIFEQAGRSVNVIPTPTMDFPMRAVRPLNSRMDCSETKRIFGIARPEWHAGLKLILNELEGKT